jgi:hypothetical protein|tara:strand:+ start:530 stop:1162 length:633 start_codon:yes stop_codon:yes gene_type:complete
MSRYQNIKIFLSDQNKRKLQNAVQGNKQVTLNISYSDLMSPPQGELALTSAQINKILKAAHSAQGVQLKLSKAQLQHNKTKVGGFLPFLAPIIAAIASAASAAAPVVTGTVLPALATGALGAAGAAAVKKIVGDGLYLKSGGCHLCQVESDGEGLYLRPHKSGGSLSQLQQYGNGLYLRQGGQITSGAQMIQPGGPLHQFNTILSHLIKQ